VLAAARPYCSAASRQKRGKGMDFVNIADMQKGMTVTGFYIVRNMAIKTSANNKVYGDYMLADKTGEINGKLWEVADPAACPDVGAFLKVQGLVTEWQGKLQLRIDRFREVNDEDPVEIGDLVPAAPEEPESMFDELLIYIESIGSEPIRAIVSRLVDERREQLLYYPAALKNHHSIRSGLLFHTLSMLRLADGVLKVYPYLDADLLRAGIIAHDLAKVSELDAATSGVATQYSSDGLLLGHIVQGVVEIDRIARDTGADPEIVTLLKHMVLSHHYEPEYGSPRRPMFPEAEILHYLDIIDARMFDMHKTLEPLEPGTFSENVWTLENRKLYKRKL
jgi:3'-5' exoribonuclease